MPAAPHVLTAEASKRGQGRVLVAGVLMVVTSRMPAEQRDRGIMGDIIARLDALNGIVEDLLLYARPREPKRESVRIGTLIDSIGELRRRDPALARVMLRVDGDPARFPPIPSSCASCSRTCS